jgi:Mn-dependent DtxR family transcriptional regulator
MRTSEPIIVQENMNKGRSGRVSHIRPYHLYALNRAGKEEFVIDGYKFVNFDEVYLDSRGGGNGSKASKILSFLVENKDGAFFSKDIAESLDVRPGDVMSNVRRFERKGLVYVRGYKTDERQTPFKKGYLLTYVDPDLPREVSIREAIERTSSALLGEADSSPMMMRIRRIRDMIIEHSGLNQLVGAGYMLNRLDCPPTKFEYSLGRVKDLYKDVVEVKLFNVYRYYHHISLEGAELDAAVEMRKNYLRKVKGRDNRIGHNWEAVSEWFIDYYTPGAKFWTQKHRRSKMDPRRITLYLIKGVGHRRRAAEVDRVWEITHGLFVPTTTYVLSCKWGLVYKDHVDDFFEVLRWSKEFGVDTPEGRQVKQGVTGVFSASAFNPKDKVRIKDKTEIDLTKYAARLNLNILTAADFNKRLQEKGCSKYVTVQKICKISKNEKQVRELLDQIYRNPEEAKTYLLETREANKELYNFEKILETKA